MEVVEKFLAQVSLAKQHSSKIHIDTLTFQLHYLFTAKFLYLSAASSVVLLLFDWVKCFPHGSGGPDGMLKVYCWMQNTFVLPKSVSGELGDDISHQGIDMEESGDEKIYITYYQWLPLFLLFQGICFEIAHIVWIKIERNEMTNMTFGFQSPLARKSPDEIYSDEELDRNLQLLAESIKKGWAKEPWCYRPLFYFVCTLANCLNAILQIFLLKWFFQLKTLSSGWEIFSHLADNYHTRNDSLVSVFPRMAKCVFRQYGTAGSVQSHDAVCLLPFNIYTEKFFAICLLWFYCLALISIVDSLFWLILQICPPLQQVIAQHPTSSNASVKNWFGEVAPSQGNWFLVWLICKNIHQNHLEKLLPLLNVEDLKVLKPKQIYNKNISEEQRKLLNESPSSRNSFRETKIELLESPTSKNNSEE